MLINLIQNAIKFTIEGEIRISTYKTNTNELTIEVADTGVGINQSKLNQIFKPYATFASNMIQNVEGTGLGLSICWELA